MMFVMSPILYQCKCVHGCINLESYAHPHLCEDCAHDNPMTHSVNHYPDPVYL